MLTQTRRWRENRRLAVVLEKHWRLDRVRQLLVGGALALGWSVQALAAPLSDSVSSRFECRPIVDAVELLRADGLMVAYSEGLLGPDVLVRPSVAHQASSTASPHDALSTLVAPLGLGVEVLDRGTLSIVPGPALDAGDLRRLRRASAPLLQAQESLDALPEWLGRAAIARELVEVPFPLEGTLPTMSSDTRFVVVQLRERELAELGSAAQIAFRLKSLIVDIGAAAAGARVALEGSPELLENLVGADLAPYIEGYLAGSSEPGVAGSVPSRDTSGRPWLKTRVGQGQLLSLLLEGAASGAALVLVEDGEVGIEEYAFLEALRASGSGQLELQPHVLADPRVKAQFFLQPDTNHYLIALYAPVGIAESLWFQLEPMERVTTVFPATGHVASELEGRSVRVQLDGSSRYWLIEMEPESDSAQATRMLVEDDVIVDPYEVVVLNQIFQKRQRERVLSLDVMEYIDSVPLWPGGGRSQWEHRILARRGWYDEYLHLNFWRDGVKAPRDKLRKARLSRPIDRIEMAPLTVENRKTYRYRYQGQENIRGHDTWKIGFEPVRDGRLVTGSVWIDRGTGAHVRIRTHHKNLGIGTVDGHFTTDFEWIAGGDSCFWDWRKRAGSQTIDLLDFTGSYDLEYTRTNFQYNQPDIEQQVAEAHASDALIHVSTPPDGHRWLLRGTEAKASRGDIQYGTIGALRERDDCSEGLDGKGECLPTPAEPVPQEQQPSHAPAVMDLSRSLFNTDVDPDTVLAGLFAFPNAFQIGFGVVGGTGDSATYGIQSFSYSNTDFLGRGRRGKGELLFFFGGDDDDGLLSITNPALFGSHWSATASFDLELNPEEDAVFERISSDSPGDEGSFRDLSLDTRRTSARFAFARPLPGEFSLRLRYDYQDLGFKRREGTDPDFVLPTDTVEHQVGGDLNWAHRGLSARLRVSHGERERFDPWGIGANEPGATSFDLASLWVAALKPLGQSQTIGLSAAVFSAWDVDRFSRRRLFQVGARVPGYSSSFGFDRAAHVALSYTFRVGRLPLRLRFNSVQFEVDQLIQGAESVFEQTLVGAEITTTVHGPLQTNWSFGIGRGLGADPDRGREETFVWAFVSRRFGGRG